MPLGQKRILVGSCQWLFRDTISCHWDKEGYWLVLANDYLETQFHATGTKKDIGWFLPMIILRHNFMPLGQRRILVGSCQWLFRDTISCHWDKEGYWLVLANDYFETQFHATGTEKDIGWFLPMIILRHNFMPLGQKRILVGSCQWLFRDIISCHWDRKGYWLVLANDYFETQFHATGTEKDIGWFLPMII